MAPPRLDPSTSPWHCKLRHQPLRGPTQRRLMLKKFLLSCAALSFALCGLLVGGLLWSRPPQSNGSEGPSVSHIHAGPTLEQIRSLASLTVLTVDVADVQVSGLHGYTGGARAALVVKGDLTLSTDLSAA